MTVNPSSLFRVYDVTWGYAEFSPGYGDTRFAPLAAADGTAVPTMYVAQSATAALLETVFHDIHQDLVGDRVVYLGPLRYKAMARVEVPFPLTLFDLRDDELARLGIERKELVASSATHYTCTRRWAESLHARNDTDDVAGIAWHSRQAELHASGAPAEVYVLFGDRAPSDPTSYPLAAEGTASLVEGRGRGWVDALAEELDARVEPTASG